VLAGRPPEINGAKDALQSMARIEKAYAAAKTGKWQRL